MKYVVILCDGMADYPIPSLGGKTPMAKAYKPNMDFLARYSVLGQVKTVPEGFAPGSDTANLSILGFDPKTCYTGRSPLEALAMGVILGEEDIATRLNFVTLDDNPNFEDKVLLDYSAGEISTAESRQLIASLKEFFDSEDICLHAGVSYRHCLVRKNAKIGTTYTPPHDITGKRIGDYLPVGDFAEVAKDMYMMANELLADHPVNQKRIKEGKRPANGIWLWGEGTKPSLPSFYEKTGLRGGIVSAVDLLKGIAKGAKMESISVVGANGGLDTNYSGKAEAALSALSYGLDYVYIHVEAPDEMGHQKLLDEKILAIENIDRDIVGPVYKALTLAGEDFAILICPDHPTPIEVGSHVSDPVPFMIYYSGMGKEKNRVFDEETCRKSDIFIEDGYRLIDEFIKGEIMEKEEVFTTDSEIEENSLDLESATENETADDIAEESEDVVSEESDVESDIPEEDNAPEEEEFELEEESIPLEEIESVDSEDFDKESEVGESEVDEISQPEVDFAEEETTQAETEEENADTEGEESSEEIAPEVEEITEESEPVIEEIAEESNPEVESFDVPAEDQVAESEEESVEEKAEETSPVEESEAITEDSAETSEDKEEEDAPVETTTLVENEDNELVDKSEVVTLEEITEEESTEGEETTEESSEEGDKKGKKKKEKKEKKPSKFALWCKKHVLFLVLMGLALAVVGVLIGAHFYHTKDMVFVRDAEDILNAKEGKSILIFKNDVTIDGDLALSDFDLDLNEYTLTVNGKLSLDYTREVGGFGSKLGFFTHKGFEEGGAIKAQEITLNAPNADFNLCADITATKMTAVYKKAQVGKVALAVEDLTLNGEETKILGELIGHTTLSGNLDLYGKAESIDGGNLVVAYDGAEIGLIENAVKLSIYPQSKVESILNVENVLILEKLNAPQTLNVIEENGRYICFIGSVLNADKYIYTINGETYTTTVEEVMLPDLAPGDYTLSVFASAEDEKYLDSDAIQITVSYVVKLQAPSISIQEDVNGVVTLIISPVNGVTAPTSYHYTINGAEFDYTVPEGETISRIDISQHINGVGTYTVYVTAKHSNTHYKDSDKVLTTYVKKIQLAKPVVNFVIDGDKVTFAWESVENADYYLITYGQEKMYTKAVSVTFDFTDGATFAIFAVGEGYYIDSEVENQITTLPENEPDVEEPTPEEPTPEDPTPEDPTPEDPTPEEPTPEEPTPENPNPEDTPEETPEDSTQPEGE